MLNKLLLRQIQKHFGFIEDIPENLVPLINVISESYDHYEKDRNMLERSIDLSSKEMIELNSMLRKETQAVKKAHNELNKIFNTIDQAIFSVDMVNYRLTKMSAACEKIYGYTPEEFYSQVNLWQDVIHPEDKHISFEQVDMLSEGKQIFNQYRIVHKNKSIRWIENSVIPTLDKDGKLIRIDGITSDITNRKLAEEKVKRSEANLQTIFDNGDTVYVLLDTNLRIVSFNQLAQKFASEELGCTIRAGKYSLECFAKETKPYIREALEKVLNGKVVNYEIKYPQTDNSDKWYFARYFPVLNNGKTQGVILALTDITERKLAETSIRENEEQIQAIFNAVLDAIIVIDDTGKIIKWDAKAESLFGWKQHEVIGSLLTETIIPLNYREAHNEGFNRFMTTGEDNVLGKTIEIKAINKNNIEFDIALSVSASLIKNRYQFIGFIRDISERKEYERKTLSLVKNLESKNKDLRQFAYIVSHNLRAPIAKILGLTSLFGKVKTDEALCKTLKDNITTEAYNLDNVVNDINTIITARDSRTEVRDRVVFENEVNLILHVFEKEIRESNAVITTAFHDPKEIVTIKSYIYSIMYNLISNAIKYRSNTRPLNIHIQTGQNDKFVFFSVKDNGTGIDLVKNGEKIFDIYKRFHDSSIPGKGIGLTLVKIHVESMGGRIEVESEVDSGTTFKIFLPKL